MGIKVHRNVKLPLKIMFKHIYAFSLFIYSFFYPVYLA